MKPLISVGLCAVLLFSAAVPAHAWASEGHQIVVDIAWNHLNDTARQAMEQLMGNRPLRDYGSWADDYRRDHRETAPWHYVNIPMSSSGYDAGRDCAHECVVSKIHEFARLLGDPAAPADKRKEALLFLIHFVGDIHQPLHAVAEAAGGNQVKVTFFGSDRCGDYTCNLHGVWDASLIEHTSRSEADYVRYLEELITRQNLASKAIGGPEDWANESLAAARAAWPESPALGADYYAANIRIVDQRLALAGLRLAKLLNETIGRSGDRVIR